MHKATKLLALLALHKLLYISLIFLSFYLMPPIFDVRQYLINHVPPPQDPPNLTTLFQTWDTSHYLRLSQEGYRVKNPSTAFPPLWPMLIRALHKLTGLSPLLSGMLLSLLLSILGVYLFFLLIHQHFNQKIAELSTLFLLAYPGALFFNFPYTESLFFCLVMLFFLSLQQKRYLLIALLSILIVLTRTVGVFLFFPLLYHFFSLHREKQPPPRAAWLLLLSPFLGFFLHLLFMKITLGEFFAAFHAQKAFIATPSIKKLFYPVDFLKQTFTIHHLHAPLSSMLDRLAFLLFLIVFILLVRKKLYLYASFALPMGILPAILTTYMSYIRYLAVVFPLFVVLALILHEEKYRAWRWSLLAAFLALQHLFLLRHINYHWVG